MLLKAFEINKQAGSKEDGCNTCIGWNANHHIDWAQ